MRTNPEFYELHKKKHMFHKHNEHMTKLYVKGMDHLHHSDSVFTFGTMLTSIGSIKNFGFSEFFNELTIYCLYLFEHGVEGS